MIPEKEPSHDEMLAMAYVDGELDAAARQAFAARLTHEPALVREVAELRRLHVLARHAAGPEPMDYEWRRIASSRVQRAGLGLAWSLACVGGTGLLGWLVYAVARSPLDPLPKILLGALAAAFVILFLLALRARLRTLPYDEYREVRR